MSPGAERVPGCPFCTDEDAVIGNAQAYARFDKYPVTRGHLLVITRRHVPTFFDASHEERIAMLALAEDARRLIDERYAPEGYNLGVNVGEAAGQTIMHVHLHVIPRYRGDTPNPRGGVRGVIPDKQSY